MIASKPAKETLLEEEVFMIRHSGEIPEVTLHSSIYYLTEDPEGPRLILKEEEFACLKDAVIERYLEIIFRDLTPSNRDKSLYRGLARCVANWQRLKKYCLQESRPLARIRQKVARALVQFMHREVDDVSRNQRRSCVNCSSAEIEQLFEDLQIPADDMPSGWQCLCED